GSNKTLDTDKVLQAFFSECNKAGPEACKFCATSQEAISSNLYKLLSQPPAAYSPTVPTYVVDHTTLKNAHPDLQRLAHAVRAVQRPPAGPADLERGDGSVLLPLA
ncbi:hypothetical protein BJ912DRAFT_1092552, partial [Pholiota molesta]